MSNCDAIPLLFLIFLFMSRNTCHLSHHHPPLSCIVYYHFPHFIVSLTNDGDVGSWICLRMQIRVLAGGSRVRERGEGF